MGFAVGEWKAGSKNGKGQMTSKEGHIYDGEWKVNKKCGRGIHMRSAPSEEACRSFVMMFHSLVMVL